MKVRSYLSSQKECCFYGIELLRISDFPMKTTHACNDFIIDS